MHWRNIIYQISAYFSLRSIFLFEFSYSITKVFCFSNSFENQFRANRSLLRFRDVAAGGYSKENKFTFVQNDIEIQRINGEIHFFNPLVKFGKLNPSHPKDAPVLLYLPGMDGSGMGASAQFPALANDYEIISLTFPADEVLPFNDLQQIIINALQEIRISGRRVMVMGDSFGALLAAAAVLEYEKQLRILDIKPQVFFQGLIMINSATSYPYSFMRKVAETIKELPGPLYFIGSLLLTACVFDVNQVKDRISTVQEQIKDGEKRSLYEAMGVAPEYEEYFQNTVDYMLKQMVAFEQDVFRRRVEEWLDLGCASTVSNFPSLQTRCLAISGSQDSLLPSFQESARLKEMIPNCSVYIVEGAGHAGTMDKRLNLKEVIDSWN